MPIQDKFVPAKSKLEAVSRISDLTGSPKENLGPGSKERKSVFINLARGLDLNLDLAKLSKHQLAERILTELGGIWSSDCTSTGQTVTLTGLNRILEFAQQRLGMPIPSHRLISLEDEAKSILTIARRSIPANWIGQDCVIEMKNDGSNKWRHTEWQGHYFEFRTIGKLVSELGGGPIKIGVTTFDYSLSHVWDLKTHSNFGVNGPRRLNNVCPLNDQIATQDAIRNGGLGLVILSGNPTFSARFDTWHKQLRGSKGVPRRRLKSTFRPTKLETYFFENDSALQVALTKGILKQFAQGRQASGASRPLKYSLNLIQARGSSFQLDEKVLV